MVSFYFAGGLFCFKAGEEGRVSTTWFYSLSFFSSIFLFLSDDFSCLSIFALALVFCLSNFWLLGYCLGLSAGLLNELFAGLVA